MLEFATWMMVFLRISAMLSVFPIFSAKNFPVQLRLALGALMAVLVSPMVQPAPVLALDLWGLVGAMAMEVSIGVALGFTSKMIFYAIEMAGAIIGVEIGLNLPPSINPMSDTQTSATSTILYYLAAAIWLSLDLHHWMLVGLEKTYTYLPIGGAHISDAMVTDMVARTGKTFLIALQISAPVIAVSFIISLVFSVLGRAVPQMNVFTESFSLRTMAGLSVFGLTMQLTAQHISNYLHRLPEDVLRVAQLIGGG